MLSYSGFLTCVLFLQLLQKNTSHAAVKLLLARNSARKWGGLKT